jgi:hypothetical protein
MRADCPSRKSQLTKNQRITWKISNTLARRYKHYKRIHEAAVDYLAKRPRTMRHNKNHGSSRECGNVKASGLGAQIPLYSFEMTREPGREARILRSDHQDLRDKWQLHAFRPAPGFIGALAHLSEKSDTSARFIGPLLSGNDRRGHQSRQAEA